MKKLKNNLKCINLFALSCLFGLILNNPTSAKGIKFEQLPFNSAIKAISETYGINISVIGQQPKVAVTLELKNDSITKDIKKIVSYCGINNYILELDDKKNIIKLFLLGSGTSVNTVTSVRFNDDPFSLLTDEQIRKLAVISDDQNLDDSKLDNQILTTEQVLLLQEEAINKGYGFKKEDNEPLTADQVLLLQEEAISKGYGFKEEDNEPLTFSQVDKLEEQAMDKDLIIHEEEGQPLTEEQTILLKKDRHK
jgi:hypothetical protein